MKRLFIIIVCLFLVSCSNSDIIDKARDSRNIKQYETIEQNKENEIKNKIDVQNEYDIDDRGIDKTEEEYHDYDKNQIHKRSEIKEESKISNELKNKSNIIQIAPGIWEEKINDKDSIRYYESDTEFNQFRVNLRREQ